MNEEQEMQIKKLLEEIIEVADSYLMSRKYVNPSDVRFYIDDFKIIIKNMEIIIMEKEG